MSCRINGMCRGRQTDATTQDSGSQRKHRDEVLPTMGPVAAAKK
jgi:hypothetical protein